MSPNKSRLSIIAQPVSHRDIFFIFTILILSQILPAAETPPTISRITIRGTDIFDFETSGYLKKIPYTWINTLHIQTKEKVIHDQLLFKIGDSLDHFVIRETERNLRGLPFIRSARITVFPQRDGTVALVVNVKDAWTTEPQINLSGLNGVDSVEMGFKEKNFLGYGKTVETFYKTSSSRIERSLGYYDPNVWGSRWQLDAGAFNASDGHQQRLTLQRPFFSALTPWSMKTSYLHNAIITKDFVDNIEVSQYEKTTQESQIGAGIKIGSQKALVSHAGIRFKDNILNYYPTEKTNPGRALPSGEKFRTVFFDFDIKKNRFIETTQLEKMTRIEDINLGSSFSMSPGVSPKLITGKSGTTEIDSIFEKDTQIKKENLFRIKTQFSSQQTLENPQNERILIDFKYFAKVIPEQTWVIHTRGEWGHQLEPGNELLLGNENGLRAYKKDAIVGTKSLLLNLEDRFFLIEELANLVSIGAVTFYDAGYVWDSGQTLALSDIKSDVGVGFRFGLTKSSKEVVIRMDMAYRLQRISSNDPHIVISFGTSQAF